MVIVNKLNCWYVVGRQLTDHAIEFTNHILTTLKILQTTFQPHYGICNTQHFFTDRGLTCIETDMTTSVRLSSSSFTTSSLVTFNTHNLQKPAKYIQQDGE